MQRTRIKICGLTRPEDAAVAVAAGADAVGVIFAPSPRQVTVERAMDVLADVPRRVARIGVFVDADPGLVTQAVESCHLDAVQFSGSETPEYCSAFEVPVIKALRVGEDFDRTEAERYRGHVWALLLDTYVAGMAGGTSRTFAWETVGRLPDWAPVFVAGGLGPDNVARCIDLLHPYAVDVSSGVESSPGFKDAEKVRRFCSEVKAADDAAADGEKEGAR